MDSQPIAISINLKIKDKEITLSMEEARDLYSQLRAILGYNNQPFVLPYSWFNITSLYNNRTISFTFPTGATTTPLNITLPKDFTRYPIYKTTFIYSA